MKIITMRSKIEGNAANLKRYMDTMEHTPALTELISLKTSRGNSSLRNKKATSDKKNEAPNLGQPSNLEGTPMFI